MLRKRKNSTEIAGEVIGPIRRAEVESSEATEMEPFGPFLLGEPGPHLRVAI
jgi:hypothetical protein